MENSPQLDGKYMGQITQSFLKIDSLLQQAAYQMVRENISKYPIFGLSKEKADIGKLLLSQDYKDIGWYVYISFAEFFIAKKIIEEEKADEFKKVYKDPLEYCCLVVIDKNFLNYVFLPYPDSE